ncbi:MAG: hypothetical protein AB7E27_03555 [Candidatus Methanomethylophilaceae archaeon]
MITEDENFNQEAGQNLMMCLIMTSLEMLALIGLALFVLNVVDLTVFALMVVMTNLVQLGFYKMLRKRSTDLISRATEQNVAILRGSARPLDLNEIMDLEAHNCSQLRVFDVICLVSFISPWFFFLAGLLIGQL